jgi:ATP-dependent DNA helicase RecG
MELLKGIASSSAIIEEEDTFTRLVEFCSEPRSRKEMMEFMGLTNRDHFSKNYIRPLLDAGRIQMTKPDKPRSSDQKYKKT